MRLQLQILRHSLPPVHIIHTTGTGPTSHTRSRDSTIADLLQDVNDLVPLESSDGEWGLEDYVVEVAATADQETAYECLHFQTCEAVLRADDEVVIRALSTEDLRVRRLGGRHQITGDGRHLVDGVTFGKQWLRKTGRPGIMIPPRKRRRLEIDDADVCEAELPLLLPAGADSSNEVSLRANAPSEEEDDDEDDEDFVDDDNDDDHDDDGSEASSEENNLQIALREEFNDADVESEDEFEAPGSGLNAQEGLADDVRVLLEDAAEIEKATDVRSQVEIAISQLKRKRAEDDEGDQLEDEAFEGFSTPAKHPVDLFAIDYNEDEDMSGSDSDADADRSLEGLAAREAVKQARNILPDEAHIDDSDADSASSSSESSDSDLDNTTNSHSHPRTKPQASQLSSRKEADAKAQDDTSSSGSSSESDSDHGSMMANIRIEQARKRALNLVRLPGEDLLSESDSSSAEEGDESAGESDGSSSSGSESSSASSESDSDDSSESDSEGGEEERKAAKKKNVPDLKSSLPPPPNPLKGSTARSRSLGSAPGEGSPKTHANNNRAKRRKRLDSLKMQGLLPENADFKALAEYEARENNSSPSKPSITQADSIVEAEEQRLESAKEIEGMAVDETVPASQLDEASGKATADPAPLPSAPLESSDATLQVFEDPSPRRLKLDLASSRRMLFSALGVRTPKDKAAEEALREKLSSSVRPLKQVNSTEPPQSNKGNGIQVATSEDLNSWKDKLIVSAVECERDGVKLPPPPFPFQQGWAKGVLGGRNRNKRHARDDYQYYHSPTEGGVVAKEISTLDYDEPLSIEAEQVPLEETGVLSSDEEIPVPADFNTLQDLGREQLLRGAIVAYKELQMDHSTNYQPEVSAYKVGKIESVGSDGMIQMILAKQFWSQPSAIYDEETGERILGKFILQPDDAKDNPDDGMRDLDFSNMIAPKLVKSSLVEVPDSSHIQGLRGGHGEDAAQSPEGEHFDVVPESAGAMAESLVQKNTVLRFEQIEVATPRRDEITTIIKEAGFDSMLDEQLLQPIRNPSHDDGQAEEKSSLPVQSQEEVAHRFRHLSPRHNQAEAQDMSSDVEPNAEVSVLTKGNGDISPNPFEYPLSSSSPYMHTQETVEYPHISQIEINSSEPSKDNNSSSHQDAQRVSPAPLVEMSFTVSDPDKVPSQAETSRNNDDKENGSDVDLSQDSHNLPLLPSEVPQSPPEDVQADNDPSQSPAQLDSFLGGLGYDGPDSSYQDDEGGSEGDSDGLPSVRELTSSQPQKSRKSSVLVEVPIKISPPPIKGSLRRLRQRRRSAPSSSPDLPDSSYQPAIKLSQSEGSASLSQIPAGSQVVDLTFSSDVSSPIREDSASRANSKTQVNGKNKSNSKVTKRASGIGSRRLLTKKRSFI